MEVTPIENHLELEAGVTALFKRHAEWSVDLLFKKPWTLSKKAEFMVGIGPDAYPGRVFNGRVDFILPQLDTNTRTLPVRLVFANAGLKLRPGMYVNVRAKLPMGRQLVVPASAAFHSGTKNLLFVYKGEGSIEPREVELGPQVGDDLRDHPA